jgi:uncharacterized membrane protein YeaQ/YmgE (transglycosylase-associated protein family)
MPGMLLLLLGFLLGIVSSVVGNLLTPWTPRLWARVLSLQRSGRQAQIRQQLIPLRSELEQLNRFRESERDVQVYLFQCLLTIIAVIAGAFACALVASAVGISIRAQGNLLTASLVCLLTAVISSLIVLRASFHYTATGSAKRIAKLESEIAKLNAQLGKL